MKNLKLTLGLLLTLSLQSTALPVRVLSALKNIARQARTIKVRATEPLARYKHPAAIKFNATRLRPTIATKRILTQRIAPLAFTSFATTAAALNYKKQQEVELKLHAYNQDVMTIFAHGMKSSAKAGLHRHVDSQRAGAFIQGSLTTFDFKDTVQASSASFGQEDDVRKLEETCKAYAGQRKILVGSSRGAATCMNYLGSKNTPDIGAAVVESPFASLETLVSPSFKPFFKWYFPHYQSHGLQPINTAQNIAKDIPIFIFCSKDDEVIPISQTIDLYSALRASGHTKAHLMVVNNGAHAKILNNKDGQTVRNTIHAFYKEYNLPHNEEWAKLGRESFKQTNPAHENLSALSSKAQFNSITRILKMSGSSSGGR